MNSFKSWSFALLFLFSIFSGCAATQEKILPFHDEVLVYDLPYDLTYLRTMEALEKVKNWELEDTEKEKGIISVRNVNYGQLGDADKRTAVFFIKRVDRDQTSIQLAPQSQQVSGGDKLLQRIAQYMSREL